ncbi:MAG: MFS transporter [Kosmotoga sp.]|nr:MAG: MFS transporter [Kosmotoga sp.]
MLIIGPILVPFMLFKGLNYSQILLLQSISAISMFVFEVPTGAIADKFSRKFSLFLSGLFPSCGLIIYILFHSFYAFAVAEILFGFGLTLVSGSDSALLYESLMKLKRKKEYQLIEGKSMSYIFIGQAFGSVMSGVLYKFNPFLPFWISVVNILIASAIALSFVEVKREKSEYKYGKHILASFGIAAKTPRILWAVCFSAVMGFAIRIGYWLYQPYFSEVNLDIVWYGFIFFGFNIIAAFSSQILAKKYADSRPRKVLLTLGMLMTISFLVPVIFISKWAIAIIGFQQIARGLYKPTMGFYINHQVRDKYRATVISTVSLVANLSFALLSPFIGILLDNKGTINTYLVVGMVAAAGTAGTYILRKRQKLMARK